MVEITKSHIFMHATINLQLSLPSYVDVPHHHIPSSFALILFAISHAIVRAYIAFSLFLSYLRLILRMKREGNGQWLHLLCGSEKNFRSLAGHPVQKTH
jgi:hypothetical protein